MEINLPRDFKEFLKLLNERRVEYLLIGAKLISPYPIASFSFRANSPK
jgi:hypothetical protein